MQLRNLNRKLYRALPISKEEADHLLAVFPYFGEFLDIWITHTYPISNLTKDEVACLPSFTPEQELALNSLFRDFEIDPIKSWYADKRK